VNACLIRYPELPGIHPSYDTVRSSSLSLSLCTHSIFEQRKSCSIKSGGISLFLTQSTGSVVLDLLIECVAVANGGDVIAFKLCKMFVLVDFMDGLSGFS
jgi:hypothetical protein